MNYMKILFFFVFSLIVKLSPPSGGSVIASSGMPENPDIFHKYHLVVNQYLKEENVNCTVTSFYPKYYYTPKPLFIIDSYTRVGKETPYNGTLVFFHGGPKWYADFNKLEPLTSKILPLRYRVVNLEFTGSLLVPEDIYDYSGTPNYVERIQEIMDYLKLDPDYKDKPFTAFANSFGSYQLFNYLRYSKVCPFDKVISAAGVYNTGSWLFQMLCRTFLSPGIDNPEDILPKDSMIGSLKARAAGDFHAQEYRKPFYNPIVNTGLNKELSPVFHIDQLPSHIPYLLWVPFNDGNVHASQTISMYEKLLQQNIPVTLVIDTNAIHDPLGKQKEQEKRDAQQRLFSNIECFLLDHKKNPLLPPYQVNEWKDASCYESSMIQSFFSPDYFHLYRNWDEIHEAINPLKFFLEKGKHPLSFVFKLILPEHDLNADDLSIAQQNKNTLNTCFRQLERFLSNRDRLKDLESFPSEQLNWLHQVLDHIQKSHDPFPEDRFTEWKKFLSKIKKASGIPYTIEEIFQKGQEFHDEHGILTFDPKQPILSWREYCHVPFGLDPERVKLLLNTPKFQDGWFYSVFDRKHPRRYLGACFVNQF